MKIGKYIKIIREFNGYSQYYIASKLELSQSAYYKIENDLCNINLRKFNEICNLLNVEIEDMIHIIKNNISDREEIQKYIISDLKKNEIDKVKIINSITTFNAKDFEHIKASDINMDNLFLILKEHNQLLTLIISRL